MNAKEISQFIREKRKESNMSQCKLSRLAECTPEAISLWETGKRDLRISSAEAVLNALGYELTITEKKDE